MKIHETTENAEKLIEQDEKAVQRQKHYQQEVNSANEQLSSARIRLEQASRTDGNGNPMGDVSAAKADYIAAQIFLETAKRGLDDATRQIAQIHARKIETVQTFERYESVEESNITKLKELQSKKFGSNVNTFLAEIVARMNLVEQTKLKLMRSMGMAGTAKSYSAGTASMASFSDSISEKTSSQSAATAKSVSAGVFGRKNAEPSQLAQTLNFNGFVLEKDGMSESKYFVASRHFDSFSHFWQNHEQYSRSDVSVLKTVNARDIEGIYLNVSEAINPTLFWNRNKEYEVDSETYFMDVATRIPEVRNRLAAGNTIESICSDPNLENCYNAYFCSPIEVYEVDDYYCFAHSGRHRCMAAQKLNYDIPVKVIGRYEKESNAHSSEQQVSHSIESQDKAFSSSSFVFTEQSPRGKNNSGFASSDSSVGWCSSNSMTAVKINESGQKIVSMAIGGVNRNYPCTMSGMETAYLHAKASGDEDLIARTSAMYEIETLRADLELGAGEAGFAQLGGYHKDVKTQDPPGYESHHIPARTTQSENGEMLPTISITHDDHMLTSSYKGKQGKTYKPVFPTGVPLTNYKESIIHNLENGSSGYVDSIKHELLDLRVTTGHRYDGGISAYLDAVIDMLSTRGLPKAKSSSD